MKYGLFATLVFILCGCGIFERHPDSGYNNRHSSNLVKRSQVNLSASLENRRIETKTRLKQLENAIATKKELEQYSRVLPFLNDAEERIVFLSLPDYEARQRWLKAESLNARTARSQENYRELVEAQDIGLGMTQILVKHSWGEPELVEVSGNPQFKNERWKYSRYVSTPDGYKMEKKLVYFEGGKVVAWEIE